MVSSVSSSFTNTVALPNLGAQALDAEETSSSARAYLALRGNDSGATTDAPQVGTGRDPAVVIALSDEALQTLDDMNGSFERRKQALAEAEATQGPYAGVTIKVIDEPKGYSPEEVRLNGLLRFFATQKDQLSGRQAEYDRLANTKPVPRQELTGKAKEAALELLSKQGYARPGTNQTVSFVSDDGNTLYRFMGDGSVWTNDADVPTSEAEKQLGLSTLSRLINFSQQDLSGLSSLSGDALNARIDDIYKQFSPPS